MFGNAWASAYREFEDDILPKLQQVGKDIGAGGQAGDELCKRIMGHYAMLKRSFDPMTLEFLKEDLNAYLAREAKHV